MTVGLVVLIAAVAVALLLGWLLRRSNGSLRATSGAPAPAAEQQRLAELLAAAGAPRAASSALLLHFSATWCGPCAGVRALVHQLAEDLPELAHLEVDVAEHPELASHLRVLSLPTVVVYAPGLQQRHRATGAPHAADLRTVLQPLVGRRAGNS
ncbi:thioredoxin family protein [Rhodococcus sp. X156]|uniref:thioredoxin family protein n=1 Tax=Rhodococcus sp. X156 TaxID=2499145 RepID=UPI001F49AEE7|nr:thioredoxin family protein [Rhodococcus sp. X156]